MAETAQVDDTVLAAYVTVHLQSGESFELLPFADTNDVKSKVTELVDDWSKSGYLIRGGHIYPWHQVRSVEATKVVEMSRAEWGQTLTEWKALDLSHLQQGFWKTKEPKKTEEGEKKPEKGASK